MSEDDYFLEKMIMKNPLGETVNFFRLNGSITLHEMEVMRNALCTYKRIVFEDFNRTYYLKDNKHVKLTVEDDIETCDSLLKRFTDYKTIKEQ